MKYQDIGTSITNVKQWKTKIIVNNSSSGKHVGDWDEVGYIMVSWEEDSTDIIPIARSDEHHMGVDLLYDLYNDFKYIDNMKFIPIFWGNNYFYYDKNPENKLKQDLIAVKKYLDYGGYSTPLTITFYDEKYEQKRIKIDLQTFVNKNGNLGDIQEYLEKEGELNKDAETFLDFLERTAWGIKKHKIDPESISVNRILDFVNYVLEYYPKETFKNSRKMKIELKKAVNLYDIDKISDILFTHNGIKNTIHILLKNGDKTLKSYFGNLEFALRKLDQISSI